VADCRSLIARDDEQAGTSQQSLLINIAIMQCHLGTRRCLKAIRGSKMVFCYDKCNANRLQRVSDCGCLLFVLAAL